MHPSSSGSCGVSTSAHVLHTEGGWLGLTMKSMSPPTTRQPIEGDVLGCHVDKLTTHNGIESCFPPFWCKATARPHAHVVAPYSSVSQCDSVTVRVVLSPRQGCSNNQTTQLSFAPLHCTKTQVKAQAANGTCWQMLMVVGC